MSPDLISFDLGALRGYISQTSGQLRYLRLGGNELLRGIYGSVRLPNWSTVNPQLADFKIEKSAKGFVCTFVSTHDNPALSFTWKGRIEGKVISAKEVEITYEFEGTAAKDLSTNRLGLCILHPASLQGTAVELCKPDSSCVTSAFAKEVSRNPMFHALTAIEHAVGDFARIRIDVEGDDFETEDQRNFGDASYKTYCHLQSKGAPYKVAAGKVVKQKATVRIQYDAAKIDPRKAVSHSVAIPVIGTVLKSAEDLETIKRLPIGFLRCKPDLVSAARAAKLPLEVVSEDGKTPEGLQKHDRVLVSIWNREKHTPSTQSSYISSERILEYVNVQPKFEGWAGANIEMQPQTHQFDTETIMESPWVLADIIATARKLGAPNVILGPLEVATWEDERTKGIEAALFAFGCIANAAIHEVDYVTIMDAKTLRSSPAMLALELVGGGGPVPRGAKVWSFEPEMVVFDVDDKRIVANMSWEASSTHLLTKPVGKNHRIYDAASILIDPAGKMPSGVPKEVPPRSITVIYK